MSEETAVGTPQRSASNDAQCEVLPEQREAAQWLRQGNQLYHEGHIAEAERMFRQALELRPDSREAQYNLGVALRDLSRWDEAQQCFTNILAVEPRAAMCHNNLGHIALRRHDAHAAEQHFRQAIEDHFQLAIAHLNLGQLLLQQGAFAEGWKECEWRWQTPQFTPFHCLQPRWDGSRLPGTLLVHTEQGIGDVFQFARFLPAVRRRVNRMILVLPENLSCMFPSDVWADEIRSAGEIRLDSFAAYLPLLSAPYVLQLTTAADHGMSHAYLTPQPRTVDLGVPHVPDGKLKVGLAWAGSPTHATDRHRSLHARQLLPLLQVPHVAFYSLQKGPQVAQLDELGSVPSLRNLDQLQADLADSAAIARQLDLIISVDTSVVHLAGGLGLPAWCLLSDICDWRWMRDRDDSYWYPTVRLFRQRALDDWDDVVQRVAQALTAVISGRSSLVGRRSHEGQ
jgi:hypothetical protein